MLSWRRLGRHGVASASRSNAFLQAPCAALRPYTHQPMIKFRSSTSSAIERTPETMLETLREKLSRDGSTGALGLSNKWFALADADRSRGIDLEEFTSLMTSVGVPLAGAEPRALFDYFDTTKSGDISYNEFTNALRGQMPEFSATLAFMNQHTGHYPAAITVSKVLPQFDKAETNDWLESLDAVVGQHGTSRAKFLLHELMDEAARLQVPIALPAVTPMVNTIPSHGEVAYPGDLAIERKISNLIRWNAAVMVSDGNKRAAGVGGHIGTFASVCDIVEVMQNHFLRGKNAGGGLGDQFYIQGHASPGVYARAFLEGRLSLEQIMNFRQEAFKSGVSSYPHPRLMPDFWEVPSVSLGLGPLSAVTQARFFRYLHLRGLADTSQSRIWCFIGDGEMDEPEVVTSIAYAGRERLNNLIMIVNCNYQRLDGPVRGNSKVIQEFEGVFRGAGYDCIKLIWGEVWNDLVESDHDGQFLEVLERCPDGDCQRYAAKADGALLRSEMFEANGLADRVAHLSDAELISAYMVSGGHDHVKIYSALKQAADNAESGGRPTVILAKTLKGFSLATFQGRNTVHQSKTLNQGELMNFRDLMEIPLTNEQLDSPNGGEFFRKPAADSELMQYMVGRREALGGWVPERRPVKVSEIMDIPQNDLYNLFDKGNPKPGSTTMAFAGLLRRLMKAGDFGKRVVLMVTDEARTFGLNAFFHEFKIHAPFGQHYTPVDSDQLMKYAEAPDGQLLQEGISEGQALCTFIASGTSYASQHCPTLPFFIYYSMFGFQRVGDNIWAAADARCRGFLMGATGGRTTLNGEGLQHQDGHSLLLAMSNPAVVGWDPSFAYEVSHIIQDGIKQMWGLDKDVIYYITLYNENHPMPEKPEGCEEGIVRGLYKFQAAAAGSKHTVRILGSGSIMQSALKAIPHLAEYGVGVELWSVTTYGELHREAVLAERHTRLNPKEPPQSSWVQDHLGDYDGVTIAVSDNQKAYPQMITPYVGGDYIVLGTDGFGRSDTRDELRRFFEVDAEHVAVAALSGLSRQGKVSPDVVEEAIAKFGISKTRTDICEWNL